MRLRGLYPDPDDHRPGFLGHILTEILLDACLDVRHPQAIEQYYRAMEEVDVAEVAGFVSRFTEEPVDRLTLFIPLFQSERILCDYDDPERLRYRLNQVLKRVTLPPLDDRVVPVLVWARGVVTEQADGLLASPSP